MSDQETKPLEPFKAGEGINNPPSNAPLSAPQSSEDRLWSALAYWSQMILPAVLPAILLLSDQTNRNKFVRFHAIHSLALLALSVLYLLVVTVVVVLVGLLVPCTLCLTWMLFLLPAVPLIWYGILAFQGKTQSVPWLTRFLDQNHIL